MLGSMVRQALADAVTALAKRDLDAARGLVSGDREINSRRFRIEDDCVSLSAMHQPRARDYAKGISKISLMIGSEPLIKPLIEIPQMCERVLSMLERSLDAFVNYDAQAARAIPLEDDAIDDLYNMVNRQLLDLIIKDPAVIDQANYLSWVAHNLERAGDRVTNVCERVVYTVTGEFVEFDGEESLMSGIS